MNTKWPCTEVNKHMYSLPDLICYTLACCRRNKGVSNNRVGCDRQTKILSTQKHIQAQKK